MRNLDIRNLKINLVHDPYHIDDRYNDYQVKSMRLGDKQVWPCLKGHIMFTSEGQTSLFYHPSASYHKPYLEYSYDTVTWTELIEDSTVSYDIEHPLYLRGKDNDQVNSFWGLTGATTGDQTIFTFSGDRTSCFGNVMSLLNYDRDSMVVPQRAFYGLFYNCTLLVKGPDLPATYLYPYAYAQMFYGCTSLEEVPQISAAEYAYEGVYQSMFVDCTSLVEGILLKPVKTKFSTYLYQSTFYGCTSMTSMQTNFESISDCNPYCFENTFNGCTALEDISWFKVNATYNLADNCFKGTFKNCTSLSYVPDIQATYIKNSSFSNTFENCTSLVTAPKIISTNIGSKGCFEMFKNCTSLTSSPLVGPVTLSVNGTEGTQCYENMFYGCANLNYVVLRCHYLPDKTKVDKFFKNWLYGVSATGTLVICNDVNESSASLVCPEGWSISKTNLTGYKECQPK